MQVSEHDVTLDVLAIIDEAPEGRLIGDDLIIDAVSEGERNSIVIALSNGQEFRLQVREIAHG